MFKAVKSNRIFQDVVDQIQDAILSGQIAPGEKLPPERELKETFSVSRGTLREALRVLEQKGLIVIQLGAGGGAIVREITAGLVTDSLSLLLRNQHVPIDQLQEFRKDIECNIARLAAERSTDADVRDLQAILTKAQTSLEERHGWEAYVDADAKLHLTLARISGNTVYACIQRAIHENINLYYAEYLEHEEVELRNHLKDLKGVVEAVGNHDGDAAEAIMTTHLCRLGLTPIEKKQEHAED